MSTISQDELDKTWASKKVAHQYIRRKGLDLTGAGMEIGFDLKRKVYAILPIPQEDDAEQQDGKAVAQAGPEDHAIAEQVIAQDARMPAPPAKVAARASQLMLVIGTPYDSADTARLWAGQLAKKLNAPIWICCAGDYEVRERVEPPAKGARRGASNGGGGARGQASEAMIARMRERGGATLDELQKASGWDNRPSKFHVERLARSRDLALTIEGKGATARYHVA